MSRTAADAGVDHVVRQTTSATQPLRSLVSPGFAPDSRTRMLTSPGPGTESGIPPTCNTSAAGPWRSYQAALNNRS